MSGHNFPREPSAYRPDPGGHLRRKRSERDVPWDAIGECIRNGVVVESNEKHDEGIRLRAKYGAISYWVVVVPEKGIVKTCGITG